MNRNLEVEQDQVVLLEPVPRPASGVTEPFIVASGRRIIVSYRIDESDFERFGPFDADDDPFCAVLFTDAIFHRLGPPGDADLGAHPLASQGLTGYAAQEVMNSSLVAEASAFTSPDLAQRHVVLTFEDTTFECVAADYTVVGIYGAGEIAVREAFALIR